MKISWILKEFPEIWISIVNTSTFKGKFYEENNINYDVNFTICYYWMR